LFPSNRLVAYALVHSGDRLLRSDLSSETSEQTARPAHPTGETQHAGLFPDGALCCGQ
jgi:hypothetical protein